VEATVECAFYLFSQIFKITFAFFQKMKKIMRKLYFKRFFDIQYLVQDQKFFTRYCYESTNEQKISYNLKILLDKW